MLVQSKSEPRLARPMRHFERVSAMLRAASAASAAGRRREMLEAFQDTVPSSIPMPFAAPEDASFLRRIPCGNPNALRLDDVVRYMPAWVRPDQHQTRLRVIDLIKTEEVWVVVARRKRTGETVYCPASVLERVR